jgi:hypothetical protein
VSLDFKSKAGLRTTLLKTQVKNAVTMSPVDTGRLRAGWKISRESKTMWRITNKTPDTLFQEYGTSRQKGREMLGLRSGRFVREVIGRIK